MQVDVLVDVQFGDCGKGKISKWLVEKNNYWGVAKYNGGPNAGHAVWVGDTKHTAHMLTSGLYDEKAKVIIGPGCVLNVEKFMGELEKFKAFNIQDRILIHPNVHIIQPKHMELDGKDTTIGTTKQGIGPAYADKMLRTGIRAVDVPELERFIMKEPLYHNKLMMNQRNILMEGSQGWWLDIDNGFYPYVTSSNIHPAHALSTFGIPTQMLRTVYGVGKVYETYVGNSDTMVSARREDEERIREVGAEYGETTGRPRKIGYLNMKRLIDAINQMGVEHLILNKMDVLDELGIYKLFPVGSSITNVFETSEDFQRYVKLELLDNCRFLRYVTFSGNRETL